MEREPARLRLHLFPGLVIHCLSPVGVAVEVMALVGPHQGLEVGIRILVVLMENAIQIKIAAKMIIATSVLVHVCRMIAARAGYLVALKLTVHYWPMGHTIPVLIIVA